MNNLPDSGPPELQIQYLKRQLDALQARLVGPARPWYRDVATLVATLAFVFSLATTVFAYIQAREQRYHDLRVEPRPFSPICKLRSH